MAIDVGSSAVVGRSIDPATDVALGVTPSGTQPTGVKGDVWAALFKTLLTGHFPSDLTDDQKASLRTAIGSGAISGVQYLNITKFDDWPSITRSENTPLEQIVIGKIGDTISFTFVDAGNNQVTQSGGETWIALGGNRWARLVFAPQIFPNAFTSLRVVSVASAAEVQALGTDQGGNNFSFEDNDTIYILKPSADFSVTFNTRVLAMKSGETWIGPDGFGAFSRIDVPDGVAGSSVTVNYHTPDDATAFGEIATTDPGIHIMSPVSDFTVSNRDYKKNNVYIFENTRSRWLEIHESTENLQFLETLQVLDIGSATALDNIAGGKIPPEKRPTIIRITANFNKTIGVRTYVFKSGEVWISSLGTSWERIVVPGGDSASTTPQAIGRIAVNPGRIEKAADLDGIYQCIVALTDAEVSYLKSGGVNQLEIWFGTEAIHQIDNWNPVLVTRVDAVVDTTEETDIGSVGTTLPVRAVYRKTGTFVGEGAGALRVGGFDATAAGNDLQSITVNSLTGFNAALAAQDNSDQPLEIVFSGQIVLNAGTAQQEVYEVGDVVYVAPRSRAIERRFNTVTHAEQRVETAERRQGDVWTPYTASSEASLGTVLATHGGADEVHGALISITVAFTTSTRSYAAGQRYYLSPYHRTEDDMVLVSEASAQLAQLEQIALLTLIPNPAFIPYTDSVALATVVRNLRMDIPNPELLKGDIWVEAWVQGQRGLERTKWSNAINVRSVLTESIGTSIADNLVSGVDNDIEFRLRFYDAATAGNEIERIGVNIPIVKVPRKTNVIQAAVDGTLGAGVTSITLPTNYAEYERLEVAMYEGKQNDIAEKSMPTAVIAAQTANREFLISRDAEGSGSVRLEWNRVARTLTSAQATGNARDTIIYAALKG